MADEIRDESDHEDPENPLEDIIPDDELNEEPVQEVVDWLLDWESWWQIIVHRNEDVAEAEPPDYPAEAWTLDEKHAPFPLNLELTWYCAMLLALILAIHAELDTTWLLRHGYRQYIIRILCRTILTVATSFFSTLLFEIVGSIIELAMETIAGELSARIDIWLIESLGWGPVNDQGRTQWGDFDPDPTHLRQPIRKAMYGIAHSIANYAVIILSCLMPRVIGLIFVWLVSLLSKDLASRIYNLSTTFALPTVGTIGILDFRTLFWELGVPASLQVWTAAFLYLCVFLFMSRAETPTILKRGGQDPLSKLAFQLLRATAMHLLAYTAYQMVCCIATARMPLLLDEILNIVLFLDEISNIVINDPLVIRAIRKLDIEFSPGAGALLIVVHWLLKGLCKLFVRVLWPLWIPFIVWLSIKTEVSTSRNWIVYESLLNEDMEVLNPDKRVTTRAVMTTLFGLKSSWPVRMRLSSVDGID
ncbi:hypothetical protein F5Y05DRAFT_407640 [Hypoxylon sp. FL0543]|nr:hypothetical protein F5Y05DRAFT_407640 [Hypoxylon sp. FL0543]